MDEEEISMTHFTVLVKIKKEEIDKYGTEEALSNALAPFQENNCGSCDEQYLEWEDIEEESLEDYKTGSSTMVVIEDGERVCQYDERFRAEDLSCGSQFVPPSELERVIVPHIERFSVFEDYMKEWAGQVRDIAKGRYGYWVNHKSQWDWYSLGGRWSKRLKTKKGNVDFCQLKELNMGAMEEVGNKEQRDMYEKAEKIRLLEKGCNVREHRMYAATGTATKCPCFEKMEAYHQLTIEWRWESLFSSYLVISEEGDYQRMRTDFDLDQFIKETKWYYDFYTHSVLETDGTWIDKDFNDREEWSRDYAEKFLIGDPDTYIFFVDCHV